MDHTNKLAIKFREALLAGEGEKQALSAFKSYTSYQISYIGLENRIEDVKDMIDYISSYGIAAIQGARNKADRIEETMERMVDDLSDHLAQLQKTLPTKKDKDKQARGAVHTQMVEEFESLGWSDEDVSSIVGDIKRGTPNLKIDYDVEETEK